MSTDTLERTDIEVAELTTEGDKCQVLHDECTVQAVAFGKPECLDVPVALICQAVVDYVADAIRQGGFCGHCKRKVAQCWTIVPI